jgi:hypothetical protein
MEVGQGPIWGCSTKGKNILSGELQACSTVEYDVSRATVIKGTILITFIFPEEGSLEVI